VGLSTTYSRVKRQIHRHWSALEHGCIDEDLANGHLGARQRGTRFQRVDPAFLALSFPDGHQQALERFWIGPIQSQLPFCLL